MKFDFGKWFIGTVLVLVAMAALFIMWLSAYDYFYETPGEKSFNDFCRSNGFDKGVMVYEDYCERIENNTIIRKEIGYINLSEQDPMKRYKFVEYQNG